MTYIIPPFTRRYLITSKTIDLKLPKFSKPQSTKKIILVQPDTFYEYFLPPNRPYSCKLVEQQRDNVNFKYPTTYTLCIVLMIEPTTKVCYLLFAALP